MAKFCNHMVENYGDDHGGKEYTVKPYKQTLMWTEIWGGERNLIELFLERKLIYPNHHDYILTREVINPVYGKFLSSLILKNVIVDDDIMRFLLGPHCECLQNLVVDGNRGFEKPVSSGPNRSLKQLTIMNWNVLDYVKLSRFDVVSLDIQSVHYLELKEFMKLVNLSLFGLCPMDFLLKPLSSCPSLGLTLDIRKPERFIEVMGSINLSNLRRLDINFVDGVLKKMNQSIFLVDVLYCFPLLEHLIIRLRCWYWSKTPVIDYDAIHKNPNLIWSHGYNKLKTFEFAGYFGSSRDVELVCFLVARAVNLDNITLSLKSVQMVAANVFSKRRVRILERC